MRISSAEEDQQDRDSFGDTREGRHRLEVPNLLVEKDDDAGENRETEDDSIQRAGDITEDGGHGRYGNGRDDQYADAREDSLRSVGFVVLEIDSLPVVEEEGEEEERDGTERGDRHLEEFSALRLEGELHRRDEDEQDGEPSLDLVQFVSFHGYQGIRLGKQRRRRARH